MKDTGPLAQRMGELARKLVVRSIAEVAQMREALARSGDDLDQIRQLAHRICGTSGTLGLSGLSGAAGALEQLVEAHARGGSPDSEAHAQIAAGIDAMAAELVLLEPN
jgi:HPt (histidine-containing phosphotransfer) domain-containing protein